MTTKAPVRPAPLRRDVHGRLNVNVAPAVKRDAAALAASLDYSFTAYVEAALREKNAREQRRRAHGPNTITPPAKEAP
jgi:predicted HicB family RNase H-like nuclease